MITGKRIFTLMLLLALVACACLPSCKDGGAGESESDDALSMLLEIVDSEETTTESAAYYVVIIPADCSAALAQKAIALAEGIEEMTGIESVVEYDNKLTDGRENATRIILGNTALNESAIAFAKLLDGDYVCKSVNSSTVIGGLSDSQSQKRLDKIPILADIPFIGRLFQNQSEISIRRNMLIFVTARFVDNAGISLPVESKVGNGGIPALVR